MEAPDGRELERLLTAATTDPAARPAFYRELLDTSVYLLGTFDAPVVDGVLQAGSQVFLTNLTDGDGEIVPMFSSEEMLNATLDALPGMTRDWVVLPVRTVFDMTCGARLVLNPHGPHGKVFTAAEVEALLEGRELGVSVETLEENRQVLVGTPAHIPDRLVDVLGRFLAERPVDAAHLGWMVQPDGAAGYFLVVVSDAGEAALAGLGQVGLTDLAEGNPFDAMVVPRGTRDHPLVGVEPFFVATAST